MSRHDEELAAGLRATLTVYRCLSNHQFLIAGPHLFCVCGHAVQIGCTRALLIRDWATRLIGCNCGADTKHAVSIRRPLMRAAESAWALGGEAAAGQVLKMPRAIVGWVVRPTSSDQRYELELPETFNCLRPRASGR